MPPTTPGTAAPTPDRSPDPAPGLGPRAAAVLVFGSSAAVLVVELVALRLLAPYLGLTLTTSTLVIGLALSAVALGSWAGGRAADRVDPRRTLAPLLALSGAAVAATPALVRTAAEVGGGALLLPAATASIVVPGALLSAVTPMVTKLRLTSLDETGTVVGRYSGIGTAGSIAGTVLTGFVLVAAVPVSAILVGLGVLLVVAGIATAAAVHGLPGAARAAALPVALVAAGGLAAVVAPGGCDAETAYHCLVLEEDPDREGGRLLLLDGVRHSYVDLDDPEHLEFAYVRAVAAAADAAYPSDAPLRAHHVGGGGLTVPRWLAVTRPGTTSTVSEIDPGVVAVDTAELGVDEGPALDVRVEDGRLGLGRLADASVDLVVGDAFGGVTVPWHLTTREALAEVARVLDDGGVYVANLIDHGALAFARAKVATLREAFAHVAVLAEPATLARGDDAGGNLVVVAGDRPVDPAALAAGLEARGTGWGVLVGDDVDAWVGGAEVLTDDHAPVDQLLQPYG